MKAVYSSNEIAPVKETIFINGFKFEICEFIKEAREEFSVRDKSRFFLMLEDSFLPFMFPKSEYVKIFGVYAVWGEMMCKDLAFLKTFISDFENDIKAVETLKRRSEKSEVFSSQYKERKDKFINRWGVQL